MATSNSAAVSPAIAAVRKVGPPIETGNLSTMGSADFGLSDSEGGTCIGVDGVGAGDGGGAWLVSEPVISADPCAVDPGDVIAGAGVGESVGEGVDAGAGAGVEAGAGAKDDA